MATEVLHNVGNILNSLNVSAAVASTTLKHSKLANLAKLSEMVREHREDLGAFFQDDPRGKRLPEYLEQFAAHLIGEQSALREEVDGFHSRIQHMGEIIAMQQSGAKLSGAKEVLDITELVESAVCVQDAGFELYNVEVLREYEAVPSLCIERHKVLQILVNLIRNARHALAASERADRRLILRVGADGERLLVTVSDNGVGIAPENLARIFTHGFTTKANGHGFGLHSGAMAAAELGGALRVHSDGPGAGATFTLELPLSADNAGRGAIPRPREADML